MLPCSQACKQDIAVAAGCLAAAKKTRHVCRQQINENKVARVATPGPRRREIGFNLYNSVFGLNLGDRFTPTETRTWAGEAEGQRGSREKTAEEAKPIAREERDAPRCVYLDLLCVQLFPAAGTRTNRIQ